MPFGSTSARRPVRWLAWTVSQYAWSFWFLKGTPFLKYLTTWDQFSKDLSLVRIKLIIQKFSFKRFASCSEQRFIKNRDVAVINFPGMLQVGIKCVLIVSSVGFVFRLGCFVFYAIITRFELFIVVSLAVAGPTTAPWTSGLFIKSWQMTDKKMGIKIVFAVISKEAFSVLTRLPCSF